MSRIEIVAYDPSLRDELVEFRRHSYETDFPESRDYLSWKYEHNPYLSEPIYYIARAEGRIVGMRGMFGTRWEHGAGRETIVLPCADDSAVDVRYRNQGIATLIMREGLPDLARRGFPYVINTSAGQITAMTSLAAGWRSAGAMEPMVHRSRPEWLRYRFRVAMRNKRGLWRLVRRKGATLVPTPEGFRRIDRMGHVPTRERNAVIVAESTPRIDEMVALIERLPYDGRIRHVRDATFFAWRFQTPIRQYRFFYYERDGRVEGYLVLSRSYETQLPTLPYHVVDWEGSDETAREELLRAVSVVPNIPELGLWAAGRSVSDRALLAKTGFVETDFDQRAHGFPSVLVKKLGAEAPPTSWSLGEASILDSSRWDMRLIYTMHG